MQANILNLVHHVVEPIQLFVYLHEQAELLVQISLTDLHSWIEIHFERHSLALASHGKPRLIVTGSCHRALRSVVVLPEVVTGDAMRFFVAQVPDKAIQTRFRLYFLLGFLVIGIERLFRLLNLCT